MSWERKPLFTKAKLFFEKAFDEERDSAFFGLWCAMGLELLLRSAVAHVSPTLLADPDPSHQNLLHALNLGSSKSKKKSLLTIHVLSLCQTLIPDFTEEHFKISSAIINQRNEELHTGGAAFEEYPTSRWIAGFYKCCKILSIYQKESLNSLFGPELEKEVNLILSEIEEEVLGKTKSLIAAHKKVFESKSKENRDKLTGNAETSSEELAYKGHHKVRCPACESLSTVVGEAYGKVNIETVESKIIVRQSIVPTQFQCIACELKISGYNALSACNLANHYSRRTTYSPEDYFDMINPEDYDAISSKYHEYEMDYPINYEEYDNE